MQTSDLWKSTIISNHVFVSISNYQCRWQWMPLWISIYEYYLPGICDRCHAQLDAIEKLQIQIPADVFNSIFFLLPLKDAPIGASYYGAST